MTSLINIVQIFAGLYSIINSSVEGQLGYKNKRTCLIGRGCNGRVITLRNYPDRSNLDANLTTVVGPHLSAGTRASCNRTPNYPCPPGGAYVGILLLLRPISFGEQLAAYRARLDLSYAHVTNSTMSIYMSQHILTLLSKYLRRTLLSWSQRR